jgi:hypothetical protein
MFKPAARLTCQHCSTLDIFPTANSSSVSKFCYRSKCSCLSQYFVIGTRVSKCFTNSNKRLRCEVMFENEQRSARECNIFAPVQLLSNGRERRPSNKRDLESSVTGSLGESLTQ